VSLAGRGTETEPVLKIKKARWNNSTGPGSSIFQLRTLETAAPRSYSPSYSSAAGTTTTVIVVAVVEESVIR